MPRATRSTVNTKSFGGRSGDPYLLNPLPRQLRKLTADWRRRYATSVETELVKPESFLPVSTSNTGRSPICFTIKSIPHSLIDGRNIFLEIAMKLESYDTKAKKWVSSSSQKVLPLQNTYCSIFEHLTVAINGTMIENTNRDFAIKAYLQTLLFSSEGDRRTWLQSGLLGVDDSMTRPIETGKALAAQPGQLRRSYAVSEEHYIVYGRLMSDVLNCNEPLPDNVNINIKLFPAKSDACLLQNKPVLPTASTSKEEEKEQTEFRILITDCTLYVPRITTKTVSHVNRTFLYTNWNVVAYTHQSKQTNFKKDIAIGDALPQKAIVVFLPESTYNGDPYTNKLCFEPCGAVNVLMKCNQKHVPFINGYMNDWKTDLYHPAYVGLTTELGAYDHPIDYMYYDNGFSIFGFDLTPNKTGDVALEEPLKGALELSVQFNPPPENNLMVIVLLIYADKFLITKDGVCKSL